MTFLPAYIKRIGLSSVPTRADLATLALVMAAQSRSISFENCDVVLGKRISMADADVEAKLVGQMRGGYCFEQNTLLRMALQALGFQVTPVLCRVRWNKPSDEDEPNTAFTHMALKVALDQGEYLADVGFAGTNSIAPVALGTAKSQALPEGEFRVTDGRPGYQVLQLHVKDEWRALYSWRVGEAAAAIDLECANWFSCTYPKARFTTSFFVSRVVGDEHHHILNEEYVVRKGHGVGSTVEKQRVADLEQLLTLLEEVFGIELAAGTDVTNLDRYLPPPANVVVD